MADVPSIAPTMINGTAAYIEGQITSARINGALVIADITKTLDENTVTVKYTVRPGQTQTINKAELLNADGQVLTSSVIYVPVGVDTILTHTLVAREGAA